MLRSTVCILLTVNVISIVNGQSRGEYQNRPQVFPPAPFGQQQYYNPQQQQVNYATNQQQAAYSSSNQQQPVYSTSNQQQPVYSNQQQSRPTNYQFSQQTQQLVRPQQNYQGGSRPQQNIQAVRPIQQQYQPQASPLENRFSDDPNVYQTSADFTTRSPSARPQKPTKATQAPPTFVQSSNRFDDYANRKLSWDEQLALNTENFSLLLFEFLAHTEDSNFMISPYSIHNLLVLIAEGASANTYNELNTALGLINPQRTRDYHQYINMALNKTSSDVFLKSFSAMIGDRNRPVTREYEDIVEKVYEAEYLPVNFQNIDETLRNVNKWASDSTNGQIRDVLTREDLLKAQLILLSGINFKGRWKHVFNSTFTKPEPFKDSDDNRVLGYVNMMFQRGPFPFAAIKELGSYFIELPYGKSNDLNNRNSDQLSQFEDRISMIVVLPKKGLSLTQAIDNIHKFGLKKILVELKKAKDEYEDDEVEVYLPRFEAETSLNLVQSLQDMGINDVFDQNAANLNKINSNYFVSSVIHKTKIRVDEEGTEASAVTTSIFANKATPPKFHANRPFLYLIVDKATRLILFAGAYQQPEQF